MCTTGTITTSLLARAARLTSVSVYFVVIQQTRARVVYSSPALKERGRPPFSRVRHVLCAAANIRAQRAEQAVLLQRSEAEGGASPRFAKGVDLQQALEYATINAELAGTRGTCTACVVRNAIFVLS